MQNLFVQIEEDFSVYYIGYIARNVYQHNFFCLPFTGAKVLYVFVENEEKK